MNLNNVTWLGEHFAQKTRPHERQWCLLLTRLKARPQPMHSGAMESGIQAGGSSSLRSRLRSASASSLTTGLSPEAMVRSAGSG